MNRWSLDPRIGTFAEEVARTVKYTLLTAAAGAEPSTEGARKAFWSAVNTLSPSAKDRALTRCARHLRAPEEVRSALFGPAGRRPPEHVTDGSVLSALRQDPPGRLDLDGALGVPGPEKVDSRELEHIARRLGTTPAALRAAGLGLPPVRREANKEELKSRIAYSMAEIMGIESAQGLESLREALQRASESVDPPAPSDMPAPPPLPYKALRLRLDALHCVDETGLEGILGEIYNSDAINYGGFGLDGEGKLVKVPERAAGLFDDGVMRTFSPPRTFVTLPLGASEVWPKTFFASVCLAEKDSSGFASFLTNLWSEVREYVQGAIDAAAAKAGQTIGQLIGGNIGPVLGGMAGALIGYVVGWCVQEVVKLIVQIFADDVFVPRMLALTLPDPRKSSWHFPQFPMLFRGFDGTYVLFGRWEAVAA